MRYIYKKKNLLYLFFAVATLLWVVFIFGNSLKPAGESSEDSSFFLEIIHQVPFLRWISHLLLRKMAHFFEFFVLGVLLCFDFNPIWRKNIFYLSFPMLVSLIIPLADETIQAFAEGRGSSVIDVWIDFSGALTGIAVVAALLLLRNYKTKKKS